jgi:hypothetical protein
MSMRLTSKHAPIVVVVVATVVGFLAGGVGRAVAATGPWWHVAMVSAPPGAMSSQATVDVVVANVGDAATPGTYMENVTEARNGESKHLVTVTDRLPTGVSPVEAHIEGGGTAFGVRSEHEAEVELGHSLCSVSKSRSMVTCTYVPPARAYEQILVSIGVKIQAGSGTAVNEVSVSGGGASTVMARHRLMLERSPSYGVQWYELTPEEEGGAPSTQAGKHPFQLTTTLMLNAKTATVEREGGASGLEVEPVALTKDMRFNLPPGLVGNPTPLPQCSLHVFLAQFSGNTEANLCPDQTVVGVAVPLLSAFGGHGPYPTLEPMYSLEPSVGEPARFGFGTPVGPVTLDTSVRTGGDYGVVVSSSNIISDVPFLGGVFTFWGVPADSRHDNSRGLTCLEAVAPQETGGPEQACPAHEKPKPFLIMPTSCTGPLQSSVQADSWSAIGRWSEPLVYSSQNGLGEPLAQVGCNRLNFEPSINVTPDGTQGSTPTGLGVDVHVAQDASLNPSGLAESTVKDTTVTLPAGVALNPAGADGLLSCGLGEIGLENAGEQTCPEAAKVGTLEIRTPLLPDPLVGSAYLAAQEANPFGSLLALYIVARDPRSGVLVKLAGEVKPDPVSGQLVSTFKETPQLPFEDLKLHFFGGSRGPLSTPALCDSYDATASIAPWSGNSPAQVVSPPFLITSGPDGARASCQTPLPFKPELTTGSVNLQAGAFTPFSTTVSREDGQQNLQAISLRMPPGVSGLLAGVELCREPQADEGTCGPGSLVGETTVSVGLGGNPFSVSGGRVYITGPYEGAPFGLSIVNPAKAGPFDLEHTRLNHPACDCVVVRAKIEVDPTSAQLTITSDSGGPHAIPTILEGIPLEIKHVNVTINRPDFTFNPTNCEPMKITGGLYSVEHATSSLAIPFQVTNCATLAFKPHLKVFTTGHTTRANGASLHVRLSYPKAPFGSQTNISKVKVSLPRQLPSRLSTLQRACADSTFNQNPATCPPASRVGTANATTPLLPVPLNGPAYFVSHGGRKFPELILVLTGYGVTVELHGETFISKTGITTSTFNTIPDVPVGTFELNLPQGRYSALAANGKLCGKQLKMPTTFTAQNGLTIHKPTPITVTGCPKPHKTSPHTRHRHQGAARAKR